MFLEKIDIQGFKSFAKSTTLVFNRELTAIVGPNGSGKSNIADAIRWVLGEQSLKLLRGKKSEDVIFSGSDKRGRLGFARVTVSMDNRDRQAPIDYDELVIERVVDRNGESEYLINKSRVRLIDIQLLLAKARVGQKSYSVIGQGMIDNLLTISAAERKDFFDEATGVRQYQLKKNQAIHKLDRTEENLTQAELVLREIEPRLRTLTRQVRRLERKENLERQLLSAQNQYYSFFTKQLNGDLQKVSVKLSREQTVLEVLAKQQSDIQAQLDEHERAQGRDEVFAALQRKLFAVQEEYNLLTKKKIVLEGHQDIELIKKGGGNEVLLNQRMGHIVSKRNNLRTSSEELKSTIQKLKSSIALHEQTANESMRRITALEQELAASPKNPPLVDAEVQGLHNEHEILAREVETIETIEALRDFRQRFRRFAERLKKFLMQLRAQPTAGGWEQVRQTRAEQEKTIRALHEERLQLGLKQHELSLAERQIEEFSKEEQELRHHLTPDETSKQKFISSDIADIEKELMAKQSTLRTLRSEIDSFNQREEEKKAELINLQKKIRTLQYDYTVKNNELTGLRVELAKLETKKEDLEREIAQEAPGFSYQEVASLNVPQTQETIASLKKQLSIIGGIDAETTQEYKEVSEKHAYLSKQTTDLRAAQKSLTKLIDDLDEHISKQFQDSFKNINMHFSNYFKRLFRGGHAKLILQMLEESEEDELETEGNENELDSGEKGAVKMKSKSLDYTVEIQAVPPGKKLASIAMLSGGEKALTAIALVCAIIANNPPPFAVLDEVDAALDEANSIRFAEIISELVDKTQFITITHNRATMQQAKILYGVTMGDDGISRLLSVNFEQADKMSKVK